jgi:hypothetical protein
VDVVTMFAEGLSIRQYDQRKQFQSARVKLTRWLLRRIWDKEGLAKEIEIGEAPLKYTNFVEIIVMIFIEQDLITKGDRSAFNHV